MLGLYLGKSFINIMCVIDIVSTAIDLIKGIFGKLISSNVLISIKERQNPLVSEYVIKYGEKCPGLSINEDVSMDRETGWYQVLTIGVGTKLSINRASVSLTSSDGSMKLLIKLMSGERLKSSEEFVMTCGEPKESIYGKSVIDLLINLDVVSRFLNVIKERRKLSDGSIDELLRFLGNAKLGVEQDLRRLVSMYQWFEG
ncbi:hypothetical protein Vsou_26620 [Vulcanisaeta souniana JCM 11219]|uniref:Uncharacterized protein n=2 Tax=Vulcanisaeta souniana JCM 11219 TaxID=1293586 RepID=A0ABN6SV39_9CREN|nr:hypothetical protein Vsou_26620 [Vulcanisaeta souniana JCM 11219]